MRAGQGGRPPSNASARRTRSCVSCELRDLLRRCAAQGDGAEAQTHRMRQPVEKTFGRCEGGVVARATVPSTATIPPMIKQKM